MNIAGINSLSVAIPAITANGQSPMPLLADSVVPEGFNTALITQLDLLSDLNNQTDLSQPTITTPFAKPDKQSALANEPPVGNDGRQDLAALMGKDLPMSYKTTEEPSSEAHLTAVTEAINYFETNQSKTGKKPQTEVSVTVESVIDKPKVDNGMENLMQPNTAQLEPNSTNTTIERTDQYRQDVKVDDQNRATPGEQSAEIMAASTALLVPYATVSQQTKTDNNPAHALGDKPTASAIKSPSLDTSIDIESDNALKKSNLAIPMEQSSQWRPRVAEEASADGQNPLTMLASEDNTLPKPAVELAKIDKLTVNKEDIPAITKPLGHPDWDKDMGQRILWMHNKSISTAEIKLNPQHLGPITVRIDVNQDQASVAFSAQHGAARDALEASIPKLREMMNAQNLNLVDVSVTQQSSSNQSQSQAQHFAQMARHQEQSSSTNPGDDVGVITEGLDSNPAIISKGLLSMYA